MSVLVAATRNAHKVRELRALLGPLHTCYCLAEFPGSPNTIENAATFEGNAQKKAVELAQWLALEAGCERLPALGVPPAAKPLVLADDSGLEVDALEGAPGVFSARFAADPAQAQGNCSDAENNAKLLRLMASVPLEKRTARFRCVLALLESTRPADPPRLFSGVCEGHVEFSPRGTGGFGYDPLFLPQGYNQTLAELGETAKNRISHRARAIQELQRFLAGPT